MIENRIRELWSQDLLPLDHQEYLSKMFCKPKVVFDIGSCVLHWTRHAERIWPNSQIFLFEAMREVEFLYKEKNYRYEIGVFSNVDDIDVVFYNNPIHPGGNSYYRENEEFSPDAAFLFTEQQAEARKTITIDTAMFKNGFPLPNLIKIDVQGCELDILKGMPVALDHCTDLIVEMQQVPYNKGAPLVDETTDYILSKGFKLISKFSNSREGAPDSDYHFRKVY